MYLYNLEEYTEQVEVVEISAALALDLIVYR